MDPSQIPLWRCISGSVPHNTPRKIINLLSKIKFDGEGETSASEHIIQFCLVCFLRILLMKVSYAGCSLLLLKVELKVGVRLCPTTSIHTWEQFMHEFLYAFENYNYDELCEEILELRKKKDESLEDFSLRFMCLLYRFHLDDMPSINDSLLLLISLSNEQDQLVDEESKSCLNATLHVDLDSHENLKDTNDLVEQHTFGPFFTLEDIDQRGHDFLEESYVSSHHSIPPFFLSDDKETSCVVNLSSYFSVADKRKDFLLIMRHFRSHRWLCQVLIVLFYLFHHRKWRRKLWRIMKKVVMSLKI
jgi:hypothetical protein